MAAPEGRVPHVTAGAAVSYFNRQGAASGGPGQRCGAVLIQPGKPQQNGFVESFNGKFRESCPNQHWFLDLAEARELIEQWREHYSTERPHSALG